MHPTRPARPVLAATVAAALASLLALTACGDDDDSASTAETDTAASNAADAADPAGAGAADDDDDDELTAFCDAALAIEVAPGPDVDFELASPDEIVAAARTWASDVYRPLADDVLAVAPDELAADLDVMSGAIDDIATTGDFGAFETPEVGEAAGRYDAFTGENCGWPTIEVTATDYAFAGLTAPDAGPTRIQLTNDGAEVHEVALFRKNDGVTQSADELLALPEDEVFGLVTQVGDEPLVVPPGGTDSQVVVLEPGDYVAVCFIPVGLTDLETEPPHDAQPHVAEGMFAEFTVD